MATVNIRLADGITRIDYSYTNAVGVVTTGYVNTSKPQDYFTPKSGTTPSITSFTRDTTHYDAPCYLYYNLSASEGYTKAHSTTISGSMNIGDTSFTRYLQIGATPKNFTLTTGIMGDYGGYVTMDGVSKTSGTYAYGTSVQLNAVISNSTYYGFNSWIEGSTTLANYTPASFTVTGDRTIKAYIKGKLYGSGSSSVTSSSMTIYANWAVTSSTTYYRIKVTYLKSGTTYTQYSSWQRGSSAYYGSVDVSSLSANTEYTFNITVQYSSTGSSGTDSDLTTSVVQRTKNRYYISTSYGATYIDRVDPTGAYVDEGNGGVFTAYPNSDETYTSWVSAGSGNYTYDVRDVNGSVFDYWSTNGQGTFSPSSSSNPVTYYPNGTSTITAYGKSGFVKNQYRANIIYNKNHTQASGSTANSPSDPYDSLSDYKSITARSNGFTLTGYDFVSWNTKSDGTGTTINPGSSVSIIYNITLYAIWRQRTYTVTTAVNPSGFATITGGGSYTYNQSCTLSVTPSDHYRFIKWDDNDTSNPRTFSVTSDVTRTAYIDGTLYGYDGINITSSSVTIYGYFTVISTITNYRLKITTKKNGVIQSIKYTDYSSGEYSYYKSLVISGLSKYTEYTFDIVVQYKSGDTDYDTDLTGTVTKTTLNSYTVNATYTQSSIDSVSPVSAEIDAGGYATFTAYVSGTEWDGSWSDVRVGSNEYQKRPRYAYRFKEWTTDGQGTFSDPNSHQTNYTPNGSATITASGESYEKSYTYRCIISYNKNHTQASGSTADSPSEPYPNITDDKQITIRANGFDLTGYRFIGWNTASDGSGTSYQPDDTPTFKYNTVLYAIWERTTFTVSATVSPTDRGTVSGTGQYNYNRQCTLIASAVSGWRFIRWSDGTISSTKQFSVTQDVSLIAYFERINPESTFYWYNSNEDPVKIHSGKLISNIKATRWNSLQILINKLQQEQGIPTSTFSTVFRGERISAFIYNQVKNALYTLPGVGSVKADKNRYQQINASDFEGNDSIKGYVNKAIDYYNTH